MTASEVAALSERAQELLGELQGKASAKVSKWEKAALEGRTILGYGRKASILLNQTLKEFDEAAEQRVGSAAACQKERAALDGVLQRQLKAVFLAQSSTIEQALYQRLKKDLLRRMRRRRKELEVKEKLVLLQGAMNEYDAQVGELMPFFVQNSERDRAQKRLSELQWGIADTIEGKDMQQRWKMERMRRMQMRQSKGVSVSLSPGIRLMFRPDGLGNAQFFSRREVGPPHNPNEVSVAVLNDGNVADPYMKQPKPPLIKFQPSIGVDVSTG